MRENKNARKGIATYSIAHASRASAVRERKQKRPQGHCDCVRRWVPRCGIIHGRENKNARKGIAT